MSGQAMNLSVGWYGKLPCVGDFASRGLSREALAKLDDWLQQGLYTLAQRRPAWLTAFLAAPAWNMILPAGLLSGLPMIGCIAPSRDRVGRGFPLTLLLTAPHNANFGALLGGCADWLTGARDILLHAIDGRYVPDQLDCDLRDLTRLAWPRQIPGPVPHASDILDVIGQPDAGAITVPLVSGALPWPGLPATFSDQGRTSYWWAAPTRSRAGSMPLIHHGPLDGAQFCRLFGAGSGI